MGRDKHMIILDSKKTSNSLDHWYILYYNSLNKKYTRIDLFTKENDEKEIISYYKIKYEINYIQIIYIPFYSLLIERYIYNLNIIYFIFYVFFYFIIRYNFLFVIFLCKQIYSCIFFIKRIII